MFFISDLGYGYVAKGKKFDTYQEVIDYKNKNYPNDSLYICQYSEVDEETKAYWRSHWED